MGHYMIGIAWLGIWFTVRVIPGGSDALIPVPMPFLPLSACHCLVQNRASTVTHQQLLREVLHCCPQWGNTQPGYGKVVVAQWVIPGSGSSFGDVLMQAHAQLTPKPRRRLHRCIRTHTTADQSIS